MVLGQLAEAKAQAEATQARKARKARNEGEKWSVDFKTRVVLPERETHTDRASANKCAHSGCTLASRRAFSVCVRVCVCVL